MKDKRFLLSLVTVYMCYFTQGIQAIILSQNKEQFFTQWGYTDITAGAAAVSLAITATGFGKMISVWLGGEISDKIGRKKMAVGGSILYVFAFAGFLFSHNFSFACFCAFLTGVATSGFWDASLYPAAQEAVVKDYRSSALIAIKFFVSLSSIVYPIICVRNIEAGNWHMNVIIPLILSVVCVIVCLMAKYPYDEMMEENAQSKDSTSTKNVDQLEIDAAKAKFKVEPGVLVNFFTMFYGFLCMFIMYGAQQYTKSYGMLNCGLTEMQSAALTSVYTAGGIIAVVFWAVMMGKLKWNPLKVVLIDSIFTAIALASVLLAGNVTVIYISIALLGFFASGGALQTGLSVRQELCPGPKGRNTGIYYTWMGAASFSLPFIVSAMTTQVGEESAIYIMMFLLLGAAIIAVGMMSYLVVRYKKIFDKSPL